MPILSVQLQAQIQGGALLVKEGPKVPIQLQVPSALEQHLQNESSPVPAPVRGMALIDTGATMSMVDGGAITNLGVSPVGSVTLGTASGSTQCPVYPVRLAIVMPDQTLFFSGEFSSITSGPLQQMGLLALLGRDVLQHSQFVYDGPSNRFSVAF